MHISTALRLLSLSYFIQRSSRAAGILGLALSLFATQLTAATLIVTSSAPSGAGSLLEAIELADQGDFIEFDPALFTGELPVTITSGGVVDGEGFPINRLITIIGPGADRLVLSGDNDVRVFHIFTDEGGVGNLRLSNVTVANGSSNRGGAFLIEEGGDLSLNDSIVRDCVAFGFGGAIYNFGTAAISDCVFENNRAEDGFGEGPFAGAGGAIYNAYTFVGFLDESGLLITFDTGAALDVTATTLRNNTSTGTGGAIQNQGFLRLWDSWVVGNTAENSGGGIAHGGPSMGILRSLVSGNRSFTGDGGGIVAEFGTSTEIENSTISGNDALSGQGGGVALFGPVEGGDPSDLYLVSSTIAFNEAGATAGGVAIMREQGFFTSVGSIIANNQIFSEVSFPLDVGVTGENAPSSEGFNIIGSDPDEIWPSVPGEEVSSDQIGVDPLLGTLQDNGGNLLTHALLPESPAIDQGDPFYNSDETVFSVTDMRGGGFPRIRDGDGNESARIDVGAYEAIFIAPCDEDPDLTLLGPAEVELSLSAPPFCSAFFEDPGATAFACDGAELTVNISYPDDAVVLEGGVEFTSPGLKLIVYSAIDEEGRSSQATRFVTVRDTTAPAITANGGSFAVDVTTPTSCLAFVPFITYNASDCSGITFSFSYDPGDGSKVPFTYPHTLPAGEYALYVTATDDFGNAATSNPVALVINDRAPPVLSLTDPEVDNISIPYGSSFEDPGATATDACEGSLTVDLGEGSFVDTCNPGIYTISYFAADSEGNEATLTRTITVEEPAFDVALPEEGVQLEIDPVLCLAPLDLASVITTSGIPGAECDRYGIRYSVLEPEDEGAETLEGLGTYFFPLGTSTVRVDLVELNDGIELVERFSFEVEVTDPFLACLDNVAWPLAFDLPLIPLITPAAEGAPDASAGFVQQFLLRAGESRWYKFSGKPGSQIIVTLSDLPQNYDVVVYGDIQQAYAELTGLIESGEDEDALLALLGAEFAPEAYSPEAYSPEAYSPEAYSPEAYSPEAYSPEAYSPEAYSPEAYSPEAYSPEAYSPEAYSPEAYSPEAYSPEAYSPEAYSGAQARSLIAFSAGAATSSEEVQFNTFSRTGDIYVRVRGRNGIFSVESPFTLEVQVNQNVCKEVTDFNKTPTSLPDAGTATSLILWDSTRIAGSEEEVEALASSLTSFAAAANAFVYDLSADPQVNALNAQADSSPTCPLSKNLVAEITENIIKGIRAEHPSIQDITLIGNDDVIPFFRTNDEALLASESNYFPPVFDQTHSNSSLRLAQVLTQDRYGSSCRVFLSTGPYDLPGIPVGRVVETAVEASDYLDTYRPLFEDGNNGVLPVPESAFISGYDFLDDAAKAVRDDFVAGLAPGALVEDLISPFGAAPADGWTADQLREGLLGRRHDLNYLAGHFSQSGALAADYASRLTAGEVAASPLDLSFAFFMSTGCHSGYQTVDEAAVPLVTEEPDWAQAFMRKAAILMAGTGYQYGDTDFLEYSERLYLEVAQALRTGTGPVPIGQALVEAKNTYLAETSLMRGIHEKALIQVALYGLPMVKLDMPGERLTPEIKPSVAGTPIPVTAGPGVDFSLTAAGFLLDPEPELLSKSLNVIGADGTVIDTISTFWLEGSDGRVTLPAEPIRPLEIRNLTRPEGNLRDVLFLSGDYTDLLDTVPLTGAPATEIRGVHGIFASEVFYPIRPWALNHISLFCGNGGGSFLNAFPAQYRSNSQGSPDGTLRRFDQMEFKAFYSPNTSPAALAPAPAINIVSSEVVGDDIVFTAEVAAGPDVGVHEVWVTYTGLTDSSFYGRWQSLQLTGPTDPAAKGIGTWTGTLLGGAAEDGTLCYMIQAVSGAGRVKLNSNFGRYFKIGVSTLDGVEAAIATASLGFAPAAPRTASYRDTIALSALLTDDTGAPVEGQRLTFRVGTQVTSAVTGADGIASVNPLLAIAPGNYLIEASFAGNGQFGTVKTSSPFTIQPQETDLSFLSDAPVSDATEILVKLLARDGTPLKEKTVLFVFSGAGVDRAVSVITDGAGQARPTPVSLPTGEYTVSAFFALPVPLPSGDTVTLSDLLYAGSQASASIKIGETAQLELSNERIIVSYRDQDAPGATSRNRGHSQTSWRGDLAITDPLFAPRDFLAAPEAGSVSARLSLSLSGTNLVDSELTLAVSNNGKLSFTGDTTIGGAEVSLDLDWRLPFFNSRTRGFSRDVAISSVQLTPDASYLNYLPARGTYQTVITGASGSVTVQVSRGRVTNIIGGGDPAGVQLPRGRGVLVVLPFPLEAGTTFVTTGSVKSTTTVVLGENLIPASASLRLSVKTPTGTGPLYEDAPATMELDLILGTGPGERALRLDHVVGDTENPWSRETPGGRSKR